MLYVACSGFPLPVSRYWSLFGSVEISDTEIGIPGAGTVRRWLRESPKGFAFTALAPKAIADSGFEKSDENKELIAGFAQFAQKLGAHAVVFRGDENFKASKATKSAIKAFVAWLPDDLPQVVIDLPAWKPKDVQSACGKKPVVVAYDPLLENAPPAVVDFAYMRLPGPAGHRSRYDDDAVDKIAEHCAAVEAATAFCVFRNIDMQANATSVREKLEA